MRRAVVGIDIGSSNLKLALYNGKRVVRLAEEPMPEQLVRNGIVISPEAMAEFLKESLKKNRISAKYAAVILPFAQTFVHQVELPPMTTSELKLNLPYEFRDFITEDKDKYFYDYALLDMRKNEEGEPVRMCLLAAAVGKEVIRQYRDLCRWAGLKLLTAIPVEAAYLNLIRRLEETDPSQAGMERCIIDLGHTGCRAYFFSGQSLEASRQGEIGGHEVDEILASELHVDVHIARSCKESNLQGELELPAVRESFQEMARGIQRAVNFYNYNNRERELTHAWLCGGGSRALPLRAEIQEMLDIDIDSAEHLTDVSEDRERITTCIAAIGAVMQ